MAIRETQITRSLADIGAATLAYVRGAPEPSVPTASRDGGHALEWTLLAIGKNVAAKDASALPPLAAALGSVARLERRATARQRLHLAAASAWLARDPLRAAHLYTHVVLGAPADLLALRLAQSCWYFLGARARVRSVAEHALGRWPAQASGYDAMLAMTAFGRAEMEDGRSAADLARRALALEPRSPLARHALAHALAMQHRAADAHDMLCRSEASWRIGGRMDSHNAWHRATLALETGCGDHALAAFDRELAAAADAGTCADATDLLWRLELAGVDVGERWQPLADEWTRHASPGFWGFLDVRNGLAWLRAGRTAEARALRRAIARSRPATGTESSTAASLAALDALDAFSAGGHARSSILLRDALPRLGGSLPQRELLERTLQAAERSVRAPARRIAAAA